MDAVRIEIPEMKQAGYVSARFTPLDQFPRFHVAFLYEDLNGRGGFYEMDLEPTDLNLVSASSDAEVRCVGQFLAFIAVQSVWRIVMSLPSKEPMGTRSGTTPGAAVVRSRFRRLPLGQHASDEARARALATFRREPLPGFTFVRQYTRGESPQSGEPLFAVTEAEL